MPPGGQAQLPRQGNGPGVADLRAPLDSQPGRQCFMGGDRRGQGTQPAPPPLGVHQDAQMAQQTFPFPIGTARHRDPPAVDVVDDRVPVFELGESHFVDVVRRAQPFQLDRFRVAVGNGQFLRGLAERQVVSEEQCRGAQAMAAMGPGEGQEGHVLGELVVGDAGGSVNDPLRTHQG